MITFDEDKQNKELEDIRRQEEEDLVKVLAESKYGISSINLADVLVENEALRAVTEKQARELEVAPFKIFGKQLSVAVRSPEHTGLQALQEELVGKGYEPIFYMASLASLNKVWERYKELSFASTSRSGGLDISGDVLVGIGAKIKIIADVKRVIDESSAENKTHKISKMLEIILAGAISIKASDIHIEPEEDRIRLRYRLDGVLQDVFFFPFDTYKLLNSRIKLLSGLKLTSESMAQDGRFSIFFKDMEVGIRTSTIPGAYGESIVMRLLDPRSIQVKLEDLGIEPKLFEIIDREIKKPNGLMLITGPTGSGKTTTLYAFLRRIYSNEVKIITIEDPIEYHLPGITQTQTDTKKGYTFLEGLRSALRQDPDVIMVGEIRDSETAKIAVESALTGHLVFSTLHTNNAAGVIPRLIDLDINPKILTSALTIAIAQRLVRKLCTHCKVEKTPTDEEKLKITKIINTAIENGKDISSYGIHKDPEVKLFTSPGCDECNHLGFKGRIGVYEAILTDEAVEKIISSNPSEREIKSIADHQGILDMREDGIVKVLSGITSLEEVESVVDLEGE
ncbi:MAG: GspE/PulE family protein [Candidatus Paceibacterota bacterium]|jgi:type IV pilus assembly protein PilB